MQNLKLEEESGEIGFNVNFLTIEWRRDGEITINNIIMIFVDKECFKFKYRIGSTSDFSRIKIESISFLS